MKHLCPITLFALLGCAVCGCAMSPGQCDPNTTNVITGAICEANGGYTSRTNALTEQNAAAQTQTQQSYQQAVTAQQSDVTANANVAALRARLAALNQDAINDQAKLDQQQTTTDAQRQQVAKIQSEINHLKAQIAYERGQSNPSEQRIQQLKAQQAQTQQDLLKLLSQ
jgi:chromosome segregation ATPase